MNTENKNIIFIKPFEVYSSFTPIISTWSILSKRLKKHTDLNEAFLLRSEIDDAKFGFISTSVWNSKESFREAISNDTLLKLHHSSNGKNPASGTNNLYKTIYQSPFSTINIKNIKVILYFFKAGDRTRKRIMISTESVESELKSLYITYNLKILKAVYSRNNTGFILHMSFDNKDKIKFFLTELFGKYFDGKGSFQNSVYKIESRLKTNVKKR